MAKIWDIVDDIESEFFIPEEYIDEDGFVNIKTTLQAGIISYHIPEQKMRSDDEEIQHRIDLYNKTGQNSVFLSPTRKEFESGNW